MSYIRAALGGQEWGWQMAGDARLGSAVMFVHQLDRSVAFYQDVLGLELVDRDPTAALLASTAGAQLILRAMGSNAPHPLGAVGVQYVTWAAAGPDELSRIEQELRRRQAYRQTRTSDGATAVEGRDPDDIVVMITYPGPDEAPMHRLPASIYGW
jgi:catechol 2,3-dioxygenase-like lactoylglutathione lyase family enzyme